MGGDRSELTHVNAKGEVRMVDVGGKDETERVAVARATLRARRETIDAIRTGATAKGDVLAVARVAGIMAAKRTGDLIPLCHPLPISAAEINIELDSESIAIMATVRTRGRTGVEMEALTAASVAALTIYDMTKAIDRGMYISEVALIEKSGGRSGHWVRPTAE